MRHLIWLMAILGLITVGCEDRQQSASTPRESSAPSQARREPTAHMASIPADVSYSIIDSDVLPGVERFLNVRLNKKVSEDTLRAIAYKLKSQDSRDYERTFILYWLPGMEGGSSAWATTHFTPDLAVCIQGLTVEEEKALLMEPAPAIWEVLGRWLEEGIGGNRTTVFREDGRLYMELKFKDGSVLKKELIEKQSPLGRRFDWVEGSSSGDHWVIDSHGNLQSRDNDGLITTAKRID